MPSYKETVDEDSAEHDRSALQSTGDRVETLLIAFTAASKRDAKTIKTTAAGGRRGNQSLLPTELWRL
jgi:hypothetical protein